MSFTSLTYLLFLPLVFAAYWSARRQSIRNGVLVVASYGFYAWWDWRFCGLMLGSSLIDYFAALGIEKLRPRKSTEQQDAESQSRESSSRESSSRESSSRESSSIDKNRTRRRVLLALSLIVNLGALGFFKYFGFFAENLIALAGAVGIQLSPVTLKIILPAGISFYTFQTMSYTIDVYRGKLDASRRFIDYLAYVSFFPQLVAGPIERAGNMLPQFASARRFDTTAASDGMRQIMWGFLKKFAIADNLAPIVDSAYAAPGTVSGPQLALATVCFAFQIYCDFSAYSDIAIGTARLFGIELMRNFAYPYFSTTIAEFWHRWHISLSTWFRDYVYIPLGGNKVSSARKTANVLFTFLISGLWHGASWNFVVWGGLNGAAVILSPDRGRAARGRAKDIPVGERLFPGVRHIARIAFTFALACLFWIFFRARDLPDSVLIIERIVLQAFDVEAYRATLAAMMARPREMTVLLALIPFLAVEWLGRDKPHPLALTRWPTALRWAAYSALVWLTLILAPRASGQFIYFQF